MTKNNDTRNLARKLYIEGENTDLIAEQCKTSRRTIQRWIKDFEQELVTIKAKAETASTEASQENNVAQTSSNDAEMSSNVRSNDAEILPTLEKVASLKDGDELDLTVSTRMALHLISLTEKSLVALDECLTDPNVRTVDKIKAAELVGQWSGLKDGKVLQQVLNKFDLTDKGVGTSKTTTTLIPNRLAEAKEIHRRATVEYTHEICDVFMEDDYYFPEFMEKEIFDIKLFLELLETEDIEEPGYEFLKKGIAVLCERGFEDELRQLGHDV